MSDLKDTLVDLKAKISDHERTRVLLRDLYDELSDPLEPGLSRRTFCERVAAAHQALFPDNTEARGTARIHDVIDVSGLTSADLCDANFDFIRTHHLKLLARSGTGGILAGPAYVDRVCRESSTAQIALAANLIATDPERISISSAGIDALPHGRCLIEERDMLLAHLRRHERDLPDPPGLHDAIRAPGTSCLLYNNLTELERKMRTGEVDPTDTNQTGDNDLMTIAIDLDRAQAVDKLLDRGAPPDRFVRRKHGAPLHYAVMKGAPAVVRPLLDRYTADKRIMRHHARQAIDDLMIHAQPGSHGPGMNLDTWMSFMSAFMERGLLDELGVTAPGQSLDPAVCSDIDPAFREGLQRVIETQQRMPHSVSKDNKADHDPSTLAPGGLPF